MVTRKMYRIAGLLFNQRKILDDLETCQDFLNLTWSIEELRSDVKFGVLPPGTIIETPSNNHKVVILKGDKYYLKDISLITNE
jgi:hypothetical protein